jgi:hypothetical protein
MLKNITNPDNMIKVIVSLNKKILWLNDKNVKESAKKRNSFILRYLKKSNLQEESVSIPEIEDVDWHNENKSSDTKSITMDLVLKNNILVNQIFALNFIIGETIKEASEKVEVSIGVDNIFKKSKDMYDVAITELELSASKIINKKKHIPGNKGFITSKGRIDVIKFANMVIRFCEHHKKESSKFVKKYSKLV